MPEHRYPITESNMEKCYLNLFVYLILKGHQKVSMTLFGTGYGGLDSYSAFDYLCSAYITAHKILIKFNRIDEKGNLK